MDCFGRASNAKEETIKKSAIEKINLKITTAQMKGYAETQTMPTLQYIANELCEDDDIEYVTLKEEEQASLEKVTVGETDSILTKLKEYPYEFEVDKDLKLASINGIEVAKVNDLNGGYIYVKPDKKSREQLANNKIRITLALEGELKNNIEDAKFYQIVNNSEQLISEGNITECNVDIDADTDYSFVAKVKYDQNVNLYKLSLNESYYIPPYAENVVDFWPLRNSLNNTQINRDSFEVSEGQVSFSSGAMYLDGTKTVATTSNYDLPEGSFSIVVQVKNLIKYDSNRRYGCILNVGTSSEAYRAANNVGFTYDSYYPQLMFQGSNGVWIQEGAALPNDNNWHTLVGTYNGSQISYYRDGTNRGSSNISNLKRQLSAKLDISRNNSYFSPLQGYFRNVVVYNTALTAQQIANLNFE